MEHHVQFEPDQKKAISFNSGGRIYQKLVLCSQSLHITYFLTLRIVCRVQNDVKTIRINQQLQHIMLLIGEKSNRHSERNKIKYDQVYDLRSIITHSGFLFVLMCVVGKRRCGSTNEHQLPQIKKRKVCYCFELPDHHKTCRAM